MSDTDNLVLEHLRSLRSDMTENFRALRQDMREVKQQLNSMQLHRVAADSDSARHDETLAALQVRVDRIERRFELSD